MWQELSFPLSGGEAGENKHCNSNQLDCKALRFLLVSVLYWTQLSGEMEWSQMQGGIVRRQKNEFKRNSGAVHFLPGCFGDRILHLSLLLGSLSAQVWHSCFQLLTPAQIQELFWNAKSHWDSILVLPSNFLFYQSFQMQSWNSEPLYLTETAKWSLGKDQAGATGRPDGDPALPPPCWGVALSYSVQ